MLCTEEFVFVHVPKTGGEFIGRAMRATCDVVEPGRHVPFRDMPEKFKGLPAICFVRNPWEWYVSWWHSRQRYHGESRTFEQVVRGAFLRPPDTYTHCFGYMAGIDGCRKGLCDKGRTETLREDFVAFLDRHGIENPDLREAIRTSPRHHVTDRPHYRDYYSPELRELVRTSRMARRYEF